MALGLAGTYTALQGTTVDIVAAQLTDCHGRVLMRVHLDKGKATIRLEAGLDNIPEILEERHKIILRSVWSQVANVASSLPLRSLLDHHLVALNALGGEVVMASTGRNTIRSGWGHSHCHHRLLLGDGWLALLVGPVAANRTRAKPFSIHVAQCLLGIGTFTKSNKSITAGAPGLHVPHDTGFRHRAKSRKCLEQNFIVDFIAKIANEDVVVIRCVLFVRSVRLVGPVDTNLLQIN